MFPKSIAVKKTALATLKNEWPSATLTAVIPLAFFLILINLFWFIANIFASTFAQVLMYVILSAVLLFIGLPLFFGVLRIYWSLAAEATLKISETFYYFSDLKIYKRLITFIFLMLGKIILKAVALLLPSLFIDLISRFSYIFFANSVAPLWFSNIWIFAFVLRVIAICCIIYIMSRYYLAPFIFIANESIDEIECINKAYAVSRVTLSNFITLILSLLGWIIISAFFVPLIFTLPYMCTCYIVHCRFAAVYYNSKLRNYTGGARL